MTGPISVFLALLFTEDVVEVIEAFREDLRREFGLKLRPPLTACHLTLKAPFVSPLGLSELTELVRKAVHGLSPITLSFTSTDLFGERDTIVLLTSPNKSLTKLQALLMTALREELGDRISTSGWDFDYQPHTTLAKATDPANPKREKALEEACLILNAKIGSTAAFQNLTLGSVAIFAKQDPSSSWAVANLIPLERLALESAPPTQP